MVLIYSMAVDSAIDLVFDGPTLESRVLFLTDDLTCINIFSSLAANRGVLIVYSELITMRLLLFQIPTEIEFLFLAQFYLCVSITCLLMFFC